MAINAIRVLICDDHAMVRMGFRQLLESVPDISVIAEAETGEEAYRSFRETEPDVTVMDISMPGMGGFTAARHMLEYDAAAKIMLLTMYESKTFVMRAVKMGVKGFLTKRAGPDELIKAVRLISRGRPYIDKLLVQDIAMSQISGEQDLLDILSPREFEVFTALADGHSVRDISVLLCLSPKTVGVHRTNIMRKLEVDNLSDVTRLAIKHGVITA